MEHPLTIEQLASAEVSLAVASSLLYVEPDPAEVAAQVATDQFSDAPFGTEDPLMAAGLAAMARWCTATRTAVAVELGCDPGTVGEEELLASSVFIEAVGALRREWLRLFAGAGARPRRRAWSRSTWSRTAICSGSAPWPCASCYRRHGLQVEQLPPRARRPSGAHAGLSLAARGRGARRPSRWATAATAEALADGAGGVPRRSRAALARPLAPCRRPPTPPPTTSAARGDLVFGLACAVTPSGSVSASTARRARSSSGSNAGEEGPWSVRSWCSTCFSAAAGRPWCSSTAIWSLLFGRTRTRTAEQTPRLHGDLRARLLRRWVRSAGSSASLCLLLDLEPARAVHPAVRTPHGLGASRRAPSC